MSLRPSLKKLRPIIEQCESRDLTAAGLASLTAHANHAAAFHVVAADPIVAVWIKNDATRTVNFRLSVYDNGRLPPHRPIGVSRVRILRAQVVSLTEDTMGPSHPDSTSSTTVSRVIPRPDTSRN